MSIAPVFAFELDALICFAVKDCFLLLILFAQVSRGDVGPLQI